MSVCSKSEQGNRVARELELLKQQKLARTRRESLNELSGPPLTTPEEAQAFLAAMRDKQHERNMLHNPPSMVGADGVSAWYNQQRKRDEELRKKRKEAEEMLRNYRGGRASYGGASVCSRTTSRAGHWDDDCTFTSNRVDDDRSHVRIDSIEDISESLHYPVKRQQQHQESHQEEEEYDRGDEKKADDNLREDAQGEPPITVWRNFISKSPKSTFPPEKGRYHLYLSYACPGSHRALIVRALKGLEDVISVTFVHPTWRLTNPHDEKDKHRGWVFGNPNGLPFQNTIGRGGPFPPSYPGNQPDPLFGAFSIREIYEQANDTSGKYTIPLLWDTKRNTIVNNESSDISYMLNSCFNEFARNPDLDLYTEYDDAAAQKLEKVNEWISPLMIHGVYRCGFAKTQRAYDKAIHELCRAFDQADDLLSTQRYLTGNTLTDADIRLFVTLLRFDEVYAFYFRANARLVMLTPNLLNFCRDIYQLPGVAETCDMEQIKAHFYGSHAEWNKYSIIPRGLGFMELLELPHDRDRFCEDQFESVISGHDVLPTIPTGSTNPYYDDSDNEA